MQEHAHLPVLRATLVDEETGAETTLGRVTVNDAAELALVETAPGHEAFLTGLISDINAKGAFRLKALPPPEAEQFELYGQVVSRSDPNVVDALREYLETYYDVQLTPEGPPQAESPSD